METRSVACWISQKSQCSILGPLSASTMSQTCFQLLLHFLGGRRHVGKLVVRSSKALRLVCYYSCNKDYNSQDKGTQHPQLSTPLLRACLFLSCTGLHQDPGSSLKTLSWVDIVTAHSIRDKVKFHVVPCDHDKQLVCAYQHRALLAVTTHILELGPSDPA